MVAPPAAATLRTMPRGTASLAALTRRGAGIAPSIARSTPSALPSSSQRSLHSTALRSSDPYPKDPRQRFTPPSPYVPLEARPLNMPFILPDGSPARVVENDSHDILSVYAAIGGGSKDEIIASFERQKGHKARVSLHGVVQDSRAQSEDIWKLRVGPKAGGDEVRAAWIAVYAFWLRRDPYERLPISIVDSPRLRSYMIATGLGFQPPDSSTEGHLLLDRSAFYQGAGAPLDLSFLRTPEPQGHQDFGVPLASPSFPSILSFTSSQSPAYCTTHPLRPPKPPVGSLLYARYQPSVSSLFQLYHLNAEDPAHFEAYARWQNSDRVNVGWKERGSDEHHLKTLKGVEEDPHKMSFMFAWDGKVAGYAEASWNMEDPMAPFVRSGGGNYIGPWDQGVHMLTGEEWARGRHRFVATTVNLRHFCFLREPRTDVVVSEPRYDLGIVSLHRAYSPVENMGEAELPHKRTNWLRQHKERFYKEAGFWC
ncbi:hypothetical protein BDZ90DRAFT_229891 [Jaminaea rosea]|uniref:Acyltransferase MbtK/IucB-like conserved domain-containing protein n=1 Tax=Jaminaea rosea TaxID=1569628 RepID=A0A316V2Y8_9BASI|nr:hypothetical protein BDZ90DRAFT_229891 [Jaminaea rosea]PWN30901.1 hypothetical protein BDZ90DRAFT_229891 [Jaminaea rosea]